jgi:hypothetical protein
MSIIPKLATSLNRRDEVPNQELAADIVKSGDTNAFAELVENLANKNKGIRHDCIKTLYEIGYAKPELIADRTADFLPLLGSKDNRMQWGAMAALACIAKVRPAEIFSVLPLIVDAADKGSVITRDNCVRILVILSTDLKYFKQAFPMLLDQLKTCPPNQLAMYAEYTLPVAYAENRNDLVRTLEFRLNDLQKDSQRLRVSKVIKKLTR